MRAENCGRSVLKWSIQLIWFSILVGCLSPVDIPGASVGGQLIVSGQISTIPYQNVVQVGLTPAIERVPFPVSGATIALMDDVGNSYTYYEDEFHPGSYLLPGVAGIPGRTYHIQVLAPDGFTFESKPEKMPELVGSLTADYEILTEEFTDGEGTVSNQPFLKVYSDITIPESSEPVYLKWSVDEDFLLTPTDFPDPFAQVPPSCYITQNADPQSITLFNSEQTRNSSIGHLLLASRIVDYTFLEKHYFTTYQSSLTKEAYEYWRKVDILANNVGSIFDTPPAEIRGNIYRVDDPATEVLGYFQTANQTFDRFYLLPDFFPFPLLFPSCPFVPNVYVYPNRCMDCVSVRNSSYRRPEWF